MADLSVNIGKLNLSNPVMTASGTFGYGLEFQDFVDLEKIGGIIVKGTTLHHREGNPYPRMAETPMGMLNAVGLQNKGVHYFVDHIYPQIKDIRTNMIVNVSGSQVEDYAETASIINELENIPAIELNISCPNVKQGGMAFGVTAHGAAEVVSAVRKVYKKTLIVKLSPNVTDITEIARAVEGAGADSVSLINTLLGMAIDAEKRRPILSTVTGGMSGAAVKPIALRMVWQVAKAVNIPVVGLGGIMNWKDAVEFLLAGATAIQIGTANFIDPAITVKVAEGINDYLDRHGYSSVRDIIGALEVYSIKNYLYIRPSIKSPAYRCSFFGTTGMPVNFFPEGERVIRSFRNLRESVLSIIFLPANRDGDAVSVPETAGIPTPGSSLHGRTKAHQVPSIRCILPDAYKPEEPADCPGKNLTKPTAHQRSLPE